MEDVNVSNDLRQLSHGQLKALEYSRYDINGYHFRTVKLEASHPLVVITNIRVVTSGDDATDHVTDYYGIVQNIVEYTFGGAKVLRVVFFFHVIGLIESTTLEWVILIWWRSSMNHAIQTADHCLHIRRNRCTT
jgi:hypothetical protein